MLSIIWFSSRGNYFPSVLIVSNPSDIVRHTFRVNKAVGLHLGNPPIVVVYLNVMPSTPVTVRSKNQGGLSKGGNVVLLVVSFNKQTDSQQASTTSTSTSPFRFPLILVRLSSTSYFLLFKGFLPPLVLGLPRCRASTAGVLDGDGGHL